jgi:hypothetical protein
MAERERPWRSNEPTSTIPVLRSDSWKTGHADAPYSPK